jgi:hypothetical protein
MEKQRENRGIVWLCILFCFCFLLVPLTAGAQATAKTAKVYFLPASGTFEVERTFQVRVAVDTGGQAMNAVEDTISFSNDTLEVIGFSKAGTILTIWVVNPSFDNSTGQIRFSGGVPTPGFTGVGRLFIINFRAKAAGSAWVNFNNAKVLANDGFGTDIISSMGRADYTIKEPVLPRPVPVRPPAVPPIEVKSLTHPDPDVWYTKRDVIFTWKWQRGIKDYSYILDQEAETIPDDTGEGLDTSISYTDVDDGIWYFHLKAKTSKGWDKVAHYRVQIDASPPHDLKIVFDETLPTRNPSPSFRLEVKDDISGIVHYEIKVDRRDIIKIEEAQYKIPALRPGKHQVLVKVYDKAGNFAEETLSFQILPMMPPKITYWTRQVVFDESFLIKGTTIPDAKIDVIITRQGEEKFLILTTDSDVQGNWILKYEKLLRRGKYKFYAIVETKAGAVSAPTEEKTFQVLANAVRIFGLVLADSVLKRLIVFFLAVIAILVVIVSVLRRKFSKCQRKFAIRL